MIETLKFPDGSTIQAEVIRSGNFCTLRDPTGEIPENTSTIQLVSPAGEVYGILNGYNTVYRITDGSVILSNDGSVYAEPEPIEPSVPTLEESKAAKKVQVSAECQQAIYAGITVDLSDGAEHFSLKIEDQINLFGKQAQLTVGIEQLEYHQDGRPCRYYTAAEMRQIITAAMSHVSYHTTYCNSIYVWIAAVETKEELEAIWYGADVPEDYQSPVLKDYLVALQEEINAVVV